MKVLCTGISGSNREEYLQKVIAYARDRNRFVKLFSVGNLIVDFYKRAGVLYNQKNILDTSENELALMVCGAYDSLNKDLACNNYGTILISTHTCFSWKGVSKLSYNHRHIKSLNPDLFVTIIDYTKDIKERLDMREQWHGVLDIGAIERWQNEEVNNTRVLADLFEKKHYVIASKEPEVVLYNWMFCPGMETVYISHPITHRVEDSERIDTFVSKLRQYFNVINPGAIEIGKDASLITESQTVYRDLEWLIKEVDKVVAFFPSWVPSAGVNTEIWKSKEFTKDTWAILPAGIKYGPFEKAVHKIFYSEEEIFDYLEKEYVKVGGSHQL